MKDAGTSNTCKVEPWWVPCKYCDDYWCKEHGMHAHDCKCPPIDDMLGHNPYTGDPYPNDWEKFVGEE